MPVLRQTPGFTLGDLYDDLSRRTDGATTDDIPLSDVEYLFSEEQPIFRFKGREEVPATAEGIQAFGDFLEVPTKFLNRISEGVGLPFVQELFERVSLISKASGARVTYTDARVQSVRKLNTIGIQPVQVVNVARKVLSSDTSEVTRIVDSPADFAFDVAVPVDSPHGTGGDRAVGDITSGGLRFNLDIKHGHAPEVQSYLYRLICTNGMSTVDQGLKVDARGQSVEEVLADVEAMAERAFSRVERQIGHFYDLRERRVDNPERLLRRIANEQGIPDRSLGRLLDLAASDELPDDPSEFDIVNLITNLANDQTVRNDGGRLILENAGGAVIGDASRRCGHCKQQVDF